MRMAVELQLALVIDSHACEMLLGAKSSYIAAATVVAALFIYSGCCD